MIWKLFLLFFPLFTAAQVTINVQLPPGGMIQKDQLWNLVLINNGGEITEATLSLDLQDAATGQTMLSAAGRTFVLGKGIKVINSREVQPVQFNYLAAEFNGNFIPLGTYVACYRLISNTVKGPLPVGDECLKIHINPLSPPQLALPADRSVIITPYPQFNWIPPAPAEMFNGLNYDLVITEVLPGQTANEAVLYNTPVYTGNNLRVPFESYPSSFTSLQHGQTYAWQVTARNGLSYAAQTDVWSFSIKPKDPMAVEETSETYIELKSNKGSSGISIVSGESLLIKYYSYDHDFEGTVKVFQSNGELVKEATQPVKYGNNFFSIKLDRKLSSDVVYRVEVTDKKNNKHSGMFRIK